MRASNRIPLVLFLLRLSVFIVMLMWTIDKFVRPEHAAAVYENFYFISGLGNSIFIIIGAIQLVIILGFLLGWKKRWTYGSVLVFHGISTISSYQQYLSPFSDPNLLFFAAWPMLAACFALYYLRDLDTLFVINRR
ncbi:MAG: hypothetical protein F6J90_39095 [Moorea sp. SIOASIH]|uniref:hypothetical protein n=1 Tax=Moorena sp. SIOASIH TaxID=2607817 RepID=UPI0013BB2FFB|nr:hypothetical protein [Moorena sp. SIOASIH]NEO42010.1 hypothetical protein [Moorena sp. SIOASIH]